MRAWVRAGMRACVHYILAMVFLILDEFHEFQCNFVYTVDVGGYENVNKLTVMKQHTVF